MSVSSAVTAVFLRSLFLIINSVEHAGVCCNLSFITGTTQGIFIFLGVCLSFFTSCCYGGNILVVPVDGSHWVNMKILIVELHAKGHNLTVIRHSTSWYIPEKSDLFTSITLPMKENFEEFFDSFLNEQIKVCDLLFLTYYDSDIWKNHLLMTFIPFVYREKEMTTPHLLSSKPPFV